MFFKNFLLNPTLLGFLLCQTSLQLSFGGKNKQNKEYVPKKKCIFADREGLSVFNRYTESRAYFLSFLKKQIESLSAQISIIENGEKIDSKEKYLHHPKDELDFGMDLHVWAKKDLSRIYKIRECLEHGKNFFDFYVYFYKKYFGYRSAKERKSQNINANGMFVLGTLKFLKFKESFLFFEQEENLNTFYQTMDFIRDKILVRLSIQQQHLTFQKDFKKEFAPSGKVSSEKIYINIPDITLTERKEKINNIKNLFNNVIPRFHEWQSIHEQRHEFYNIVNCNKLFYFTHEANPIHEQHTEEEENPKYITREKKIILIDEEKIKEMEKLHLSHTFASQGLFSFDNMSFSSEVFKVQQQETNNSMKMDREKRNNILTPRVKSLDNRNQEESLKIQLPAIAASLKPSQFLSPKKKPNFSMKLSNVQHGSKKKNNFPLEASGLQSPKESFKIKLQSLSPLKPQEISLKKDWDSSFVSRKERFAKASSPQNTLSLLSPKGFKSLSPEERAQKIISTSKKRAQEKNDNLSQITPFSHHHTPQKGFEARNFNLLKPSFPEIKESYAKKMANRTKNQKIVEKKETTIEKTENLNVQGTLVVENVQKTVKKTFSNFSQMKSSGFSPEQSFIAKNNLQNHNYLFEGMTKELNMEHCTPEESFVVRNPKSLNIEELTVIKKHTHLQKNSDISFFLSRDKNSQNLEISQKNSTMIFSEKNNQKPFSPMTRKEEEARKKINFSDSKKKIDFTDSDKKIRSLSSKKSNKSLHSCPSHFLLSLQSSLEKNESTI